MISSFVLAEKLELGELRNLFGYQFKSKLSFGSVQYFEFEGERASIKLNFIPAPSEDIAEAFIDDKFAMFKSVYEAKRVDYPGQYSKVIECPAEFKPKFFPTKAKDGKLAYYLGFANKNKVPGACASDLIAYTHFYGLINCKARAEVLEIEGFFDLTNDNVEKLVKDISCDI